MIKDFFFPVKEKIELDQPDEVSPEDQENEEEPLPIEIKTSEITADGKIKLIFSENLKNLDEMEVTLKVMQAIRYQILDVKYKSLVKEDDGKGQTLPLLEKWDIISFTSSDMII
jgi:hypothetical protein